MKPHKHCELIKVWADGAKIQYKIGNDEWRDCIGNAPVWGNDDEYRIKPEPLALYVNEYRDNCKFEGRFGVAFTDENSALAHSGHVQYIRTIKLMEVEDD